MIDAAIVALLKEHHEVYDSDCGTHFGCSCETETPEFRFEGEIRSDGTKRPQYWAFDERREWWEQHVAELIAAPVMDATALCETEFVYENHPMPYICSRERGHDGYHSHQFTNGETYSGPTIERKPQ